MRDSSFITLILCLLTITPVFHCLGGRKKQLTQETLIGNGSSRLDRGNNLRLSRNHETTSVRRCPPLRLSQAEVRVSLPSGPIGTDSISQIVVECDSSASSLSGTDTLSWIRVTECPTPGSDLAKLLQPRVQLICVPDQTYRRFARDNLNLGNGKPVRILHMRVSNSTSEMRILRKRFEHDDLRLAYTVDPSVYVDINPTSYARHPSIVFVNERISSVLDRLVSSHQNIAIDARYLAISPIISEYIRSDNTTVHLIQVRSFQDGRIIAGFRRELSQIELEQRTSFTNTDGLRQTIQTNSIDPDGICCFCDDPKQTPNTTLLKLCCFHEYHEPCIRKWIFENGKSHCPECRSLI